MQFAVAISIAESIEKGQNITEVRIDSYDPKKPLITLGKKLWHQFKTEASNDPNIKLLSEAISKIKFKASTSQNVLRGGNIVSESWISAIHAVHPTTVLLRLLGLSISIPSPKRIVPAAAGLRRSSRG